MTAPWPHPRSWLLAWGLGLAPLGCSILVSTSGLTGGSADASTHDAGASDGALVGDGAPGTDAAALDGASPDAARGPFCLGKLPRPTFCDDFDVSPNIDDFWTFHSTSGFTTGGISELDRAASLTPPASLHLSVPGGVPGTGEGMVNRYAFDVKATGAPTSLHVECDMRVDAMDPLHGAYIVWLGFGDTLLDQVLLTVSTSATRLVESYDKAGGGSAQVSTDINSFVKAGVWTHVDLDLTVSSNVTVDVKLDGAVVLAGHVLQAGYLPAAGGGVGFSLGPGYFTSNTVAQTEVHFDNALFQVTPAP